MTTLTEQSRIDRYGTTQLKLSSADGPVYRTVSLAPLRDADPSEIPVIDVSGIFSDSLQARKGVAKQIHDAATNNGFFYIANHGIPAEVTEAVHSASLDFFRQPLATKMQADQRNSHFYNGYKPPKSQRLNDSESIDIRESFSWTYDPAYDPSVPDVAAIPPRIARHLHSEDTHWHATANLPHFKSALVAYTHRALPLARALVRSLALSLSLPESFFDAKFSHPDAALGLNYYPPIPAPPPQEASSSSASDETQVSIGSHTDFQLLTLLWQDPIGGLQVLTKKGEWIAAPPIPGTLVVNIGDYLQRITNDKYVSTVHRAQNRGGSERVSVPYFFGFNLCESCGVLESCVGEGEVARYEEVSCLEWVRRRVADMHDTGQGKA